MTETAHTQSGTPSPDPSTSATAAQPAPTERGSVKTVIVLGAPRSGTSMTAGLLNALGVSMGDVRNPDPLNPTGYFEDREFLALGDDIFRAAEPGSNGFRPPSIEALRQQKGKFDDRIRELIARRTQTCPGQSWGWKTAATCFLADYFLPYLPNPYFVVVLRNPASSADSAVRYVQHPAKERMYDALSLVEALQVVSRYEDSIYNLLARNPRIPRLVLAYERVVTAPDHTVQSLTSFLNITIDEARVQSAKDFVSTGRTMQRRQWRSDMQRRARGVIRKITRKLMR